MNVTKSYNFFLGFFLLFFQYCLAQRGYNYVRPSISRGSPSAATPITNPLRPIVTTLPTGNAASGTGFATASTAFGAPSSANVVPTSTGLSGFQSNIVTGYSPAIASTVIGSNFGAGTSTGLTSRLAPVQRPNTALFGANTSRGQSTQFTSSSATGTGSGGDIDYEGDGDYSAIPGIAGVNYPIYSQVPQTSFDCAQQTLPGYYSDVEAQCQVFHICALNRTYSFLCPNGTVFSQETLVCVWWNQYDCASAPTLYANNAYIYDYGNEGISTGAANYQGTGNQIGIGSSRSQSGFQISPNTGRNSGITQQTGIFSGSVGARPNLSSGGFGGISTPSPATTFNGRTIAGQTSVGRRQQGGVLPTALGQTFSDISTATTPATVGNIARGGFDGTGFITGGGIGAQQSTLQTSQLSTSLTDREYLPPARRQ